MFEHKFKLGEFDIKVLVDDTRAEANVIIQDRSLGSFPYGSRDYSGGEDLELFATNMIVSLALAYDGGA